MSNNNDKELAVNNSSPGENGKDENSTPPDPFDLDAMRAGTGDGVFETDEVSIIRCGKPNKEVPLRFHPDQSMLFDCYLFKPESLMNDRPYVVSRKVATHPNVVNHTKHRVLVPAMNIHRELLLVPMHHPHDIRSKEWGRSFRAAVEIGRRQWVRIEADMRIGRYRAFSVPAGSAPDDVEWPVLTMEEMVMQCFAENFITSIDHELIRPLLGEQLC